MKTRKPFYKRWWFLVLAVLVVLTIIGSISARHTIFRTPLA
mgnify:CR=1 FL=1